MGRRTAIILGHSHVAALTMAIASRRELDVDAGLDFFALNATLRPGFLNYAEIFEGERIFNRAVLAEVDATVPAEDQALFVASFGGNAHNAVGMLQADPDFDFYVFGEPWEPPRDGLSLAPAYMIRTRLVIEAMAALEHLSLLQGLGRGKVICLGSPPPLEDNVRLTDILDEIFKVGRATWAVARPGLRKKLWLLHTEIFRTHCAAIGVEFVSCPPSTIGDNGYLRPEFGFDATHGNVLYGELVLQQILKAAGPS